MNQQVTATMIVATIIITLLLPLKTQSTSIIIPIQHHPGHWNNRQFLVCSKDFQTKITTPISGGLLECALLCATLNSGQCLSYNYLPAESACQIFSHVSRHFNVANLVNVTCLYFVPGESNQLEQPLGNLALRKPAYSSALYDPTVSTPDKAVDGVRSLWYYSSTSCFHTKAGPPNWFAVDLQDVYRVLYVMLVNRNAAGYRLNHYILGLNNTLGSQVTRWDYELCGQYPGITEDSFWYITLCMEYPYGHRYVFLQSAKDTDQYLTVCEFEVYGL